jgi:hypothetical protein
MLCGSVIEIDQHHLCARGPPRKSVKRIDESTVQTIVAAAAQTVIGRITAHARPGCAESDQLGRLAKFVGFGVNCVALYLCGCPPGQRHNCQIVSCT